MVWRHQPGVPARPGRGPDVLLPPAPLRSVHHGARGVARTAQQSEGSRPDVCYVGEQQSVLAGAPAHLRWSPRWVGALAAGAVVAGLAAAPPAQAGADRASVREVVTWAVPSADLDALTRTVGAAGARVVKRIGLAGSLVVDVPLGWRAPRGVLAVADRELRLAGASYDGPPAQPLRPTLGLAGTGDEGDGVTVALVDTGVADVPDLAGAVEHVNVSGEAAGDGYGHGTFMAGLVAAHGVTSGGRVVGVAPRARVLDVQVAGPDGSTSLVKVLRGLEAVAERAQQDPSVRVVNLSLSSGSSLPPHLDPLARGLQALWDNGLVVVVPSGNDGEHARVASPGNDPLVLTVGALDDQGTVTRSDDQVAGFSSYGRTYGVAKPEVVAPGSAVVSLRAPGSVIDRIYPSARVGAAHFKGSGTSMAAAVTSGAVAALLAQRPDLTPDAVKAALAESAYDVPGRRYAAGAGGVDVPAALAAALDADAEWAPPRVREAWIAFAAAWSAGDRDAAVAAWRRLPPSLQARAAAAFATAVSADGVAEPEQVQQAWEWARAPRDLDEWLARAWSARAWSADDWTARAWSARAWSARAWSARAWSARAWSARAWSARAWSARAWSARAWSADQWSARAWSARAWSASIWGDG